MFFFFFGLRPVFLTYITPKIGQVRVRVILFNATFNKISVIWWLSVLFVEEVEVPGGEYHRPVESH